MITAIVLYQLPPHIDLAACAAHFRSIAPGFGDVPGLIRKQFIYAGPWLDGIRERYGMDPQIRFFETACITDNASETVLLDAVSY